MRVSSYLGVRLYGSRRTTLLVSLVVAVVVYVWVSADPQSALGHTGAAEDRMLDTTQVSQPDPDRYSQQRVGVDEGSSNNARAVQSDPGEQNNDDTQHSHSEHGDPDHETPASNPAPGSHPAPLLMPPIDLPKVPKNCFSLDRSEMQCLHPDLYAEFDRLHWAAQYQTTKSENWTSPDIRLCSAGADPELVQSELRQAEVVVAKPLVRMGRSQVSLVVFVDCLEGDGSVLQRLLDSLDRSDYKVRFVDAVDITFWVDPRARPVCVQKLRDFDWSKHGKKTLIFWKCQRHTIVDWWRRVYLVAPEPVPTTVLAKSSILVIEDGNILSAQFMKWAMLSSTKMLAGYGTNVVGVLLRPTPNRQGITFPPAFMPSPMPSIPFSRSELHRPTPGRVTEMIITHASWQKFSAFIGKAQVEYAKEPWVHSFAALIALYCHQENMFFYVPRLRSNVPLAQTLSIDGQDLSRAPTTAFNDPGSKPPSLPVAPCQLEWDGQPNEVVRRVVEISRAREFVMIRDVNSTEVESVLSWLCQLVPKYTNIAGVLERIVLIAVDKTAYEALSGNPFRVPILKGFTANTPEKSGLVSRWSIEYATELIRRLKQQSLLLNCGASIFRANSNLLWLKSLYPLLSTATDTDMYVYGKRRSMFGNKLFVTVDEDVVFFRNSRTSMEIFSLWIDRIQALLDEYSARSHVGDRSPPIFLRPLLSFLIQPEENFFFNFDYKSIPEVKYEVLAVSSLIDQSWYTDNPDPARVDVDPEAYAITLHNSRDTQVKYGHFFLRADRTCDADALTKFARKYIPA